MLRISRTFLKIAKIVSTVCAGIMLACAPVMLVLGFSGTIHDMLLAAINDGTLTVSSSAGLTNEQIVAVFQGTYIASGFVLLFFGGVCLANALISSKTSREPTRNRYIACIVTGALSTDFSIPAAILGLISMKQEEQKPEIEE